MGSNLFTICFWICLSCSLSHVNGYYNYHFMEEECNENGTHIDLTKETSLYGHVELVRDGGYSPNLQCKLTIWAPVGYRLTVRFKRIEIFKPENSCTTDYLLLSGNTTTHRYCGTGTPGYSLISTGRFLELEFVSGDWDFDNDRMGFWLYYTAFHQGPCDTEDGDEFECYRDYRCIPGELTCDHLDNCGDWSDERSSVCGLPTGTIVMISLISIMCCGVCFAGAVYFVIDKKKDQTRNRRRRQNQNNVIPAVEYNAGLDVNAPPPYSTYFTTPPYSENKELPPAYSNYGYDTADSVTTATVSDATTTTTTHSSSTSTESSTSPTTLSTVVPIATTVSRSSSLSSSSSSIPADVDVESAK